MSIIWQKSSANLSTSIGNKFSLVTLSSNDYCRRNFGRALPAAGAFGYGVCVLTLRYTFFSRKTGRLTMAKVGLFYGSTTGKTADAAEAIQAALGGDSVVDLFDISDKEAADLAEYDYLIIGCPTWNIGDLQDDWDAILGDLDDVDFSGKTVAYFGTGDQIGYADNFQDAMGILEEKNCRTRRQDSGLLVG